MVNKNTSEIISGLLIFLFLFSFACKKEEVQEQTIVQISTIDALLQGVYDGTTSLGELSAYGDFGIGTFNTLDGEMVFLDGTFYQVKADGKIYMLEKSVLSPFAAVTFFNPEIKYEVSALSYAGLKLTIDSLMLSSNLFYAIRLHGTFDSIRTRSVPASKNHIPPCGSNCKPARIYRSIGNRNFKRILLSSFCDRN